MYKDFTNDLDSQLQELIDENDVLEKIVSMMAGKTKGDKMQEYVYQISKQKIKHNYETIALYNTILEDIYGKTGIVA